MKKLMIMVGLLLATFAAPVAADAADTQAPTVELKAWDSAVYGDTLPADVIVTDDVGVTKVEYAIDDVVVRTAQAPNFDVFIDLTGFAAETHNLKAKAYDAAGNVAITRPRNFTIDRTGPEVTIHGPTITNAANPQFRFSSSSADYGQAGCIVQDRGPDRDYFECSKDVPFASGAPLADGEWQFVVHASDAVHNKTVARHLFVVDRTLPRLVSTAGPENGATVRRREVSYAWKVEDKNLARQVCSVDSGTPVDCEGGIDLELSDGPHTLVAAAIDEAGNVGRLSRRVIVDTGSTVDPDPDPDDPAKDTAAPVIELASPKQKLKALRKGLAVRVTCSEACAGPVVARPTKRTKKTRGIKFKTRVSLPAAGSATVKLKPTAKARKKLKRLVKAKRPLKLTTTSRLADPSGNTSTFSLKTKSRP